MKSAMDVYTHNCLHLDNRYGALVHRLKTVDEQLAFPTIVKTLTGTYTAKIKDSHGNEKYIHSSRDPRREAEEWISHVYKSDIDLFVIVGFGCGHHLCSLLNMMHKEQKMLVVEPFPVLFKKVLRYIDIENLIHDTKFYLMVEQVPSIIIQNLFDFLMRYTTPDGVSLKTLFIDFYGRNGICDDLCETIRYEIERSLGKKQQRWNALSQKLKDLTALFPQRKVPRSYKEMLSFFKQRDHKELPLNEQEFISLASYFLCGHYAYEEQ
jgi:hypothetical protein